LLHIRRGGQWVCSDIQILERRSWLSFARS